MSQNIFQTIRSEYERRQKHSLEKLADKRSLLYASLPEIEEIDRMIGVLGVKYNKMILLGGSIGDNPVEELLHELTRIKERKENILNAAGYPSNYPAAEYLCAKCKDTGYIEAKNSLSERCSCYRQQLVGLLYAQSNLKLAEREHFETFNENYYPDIVDEARYGIDISPRENILLIKEQCINFIDNFNQPEQKNLFFSGPAGIGKTFMSNCIASELLKQGTTIIYLSSPALFNIINEYRMKAYKDDDFDENPYKNITGAELLIIDDLGTEPPSASKFSELLNILNTRHINNLTKPCKTVISSNIEAMDLHKYYQERITSRIFGCFEVYRFAGEDIRRIIKLNEA